MWRVTNLRLLLVGWLLFWAATMGTAVARVPTSYDTSATIRLADLPPQGTQVYTLIFKGGPFAYERDGVVFGNRERLLPLNKRGYYLEYTVPTPGLRHRGVKRIVCGGQRTAPDACYYTADHYESFRKIVP